jgi:hypothetical protein
MTSDFSGQRVLLSQIALFDIAGSEVVAHELAQYFSDAGAEVIVATYGFSDAWRERFASIERASVFRYDDEQLDRLLEERLPDIAWVHHQVIPERVLRNPAGTTFVFHHMSAYQLQEFPLSPEIERSLASAVVFPAPETLAAQVESGLLAGIDSHRLRVFGNPAPDTFARSNVTSADSLERLLIVSNHPPREVTEAIALLRSSGIEVVSVGGDAADPNEKRLVTPSDIQGVDAVLSIGKTVQYSIVAGVPVYCYDHFGGPGWLTPADFDAARETNFSGRGFVSRPSEQIARELIDGYSRAASDAQLLRVGEGSAFLMSDAVERLFDSLRPATFEPISEEQIIAFLARSGVFNGLVNALESRTLTVRYLRGLTSKLETENEKLRHELRHLNATPGVQAAVKAFDGASKMKRRVLGR